MIKYLIAFFLFLFFQNSYAETCYNWSAPNAYQNGPNMVYFCPSGWSHVLPENECRSVVPCPDVVINTPDCVEGYEKVYNNVDGTLYGCMIPCPSNQIRDHWSDGDPMNSCRIDCPQDMGLEIRDDQCELLECYNERQELVILNSKPYRACLYKCAVGEERSFQKYNDYNCHKKICPLGSHFENDVCVKDPEPEPDTCLNSVVEAVNCLKESVLDSLQNLDKTSIFDDIIYTLSDLSNILDSKNNSENPDNPSNPDNPINTDDQDIDTSEFSAELPIVELQKDILSTDKFSYSAQCPIDKSFSIWSFTYSFSYQRICQALDKLSYLVLALSFLFAGLIIVRQ